MALRLAEAQPQPERTNERMTLRLAEAQQLYDAINDPLLAPALKAFFEDHRQNTINQLLSSVRQSVRDTMKEAKLAGKEEAYANAMDDLKLFAQRQMKDAA